MTKVTALVADITQISADAIVNAANSTLLGGGGVDAAIHRAAGPKLREECARLGGCRTGEAKITRGYNLPAKHVIHTVGPIYTDGAGGEPEFLAKCYTNVLMLAVRHGIRTIAIPAIATGNYGYPKVYAAGVVSKTVREFLKNNPDRLEEIMFVFWKKDDLDIFLKTWNTADFYRIDT